MDNNDIVASAKTIVKDCQTEEHSFTCDKTVEENICWQIHADAVLRDIKYLLKEFILQRFQTMTVCLKYILLKDKNLVLPLRNVNLSIFGHNFSFFRRTFKFSHGKTAVAF